MTGYNYGFINFHTEEAARGVMEEKDDLIMDGEKVELECWTQTPGKRQNPGPIVETRGHTGNHSGSLEEILSQSRAKGWGNPQYSLETEASGSATSTQSPSPSTRSSMSSGR